MQNAVEAASLFEEEEQNMKQRIVDLERKTQYLKVKEFVQRLEVVNDSDEGRKPFWIAVNKYWKENPRDA